MKAFFPTSTTVSALVAIPSVKADPDSPLMDTVAKTVKYLSQSPKINNTPDNLLASAINKNSVAEDAPSIAALTNIETGKAVSPLPAGGVKPGGPSQGIT